MNFNDSLMIRADIQLVCRRQHALTQHAAQWPRIQHERLIVIKTRWHGAFWRQPNRPHSCVYIRRTADHLHQPVLITRHISHHAAIIDLGHTQPISIRMFDAFNHPDNSRATIFSFEVDHFFDTAKLLIDPRHQLIHGRQFKINQLFDKI